MRLAIAYPVASSSVEMRLAVTGSTANDWPVGLLGHNGCPRALTLPGAPSVRTTIKDAPASMPTLLVEVVVGKPPPTAAAGVHARPRPPGSVHLRVGSAHARDLRLPRDASGPYKPLCVALRGCFDLRSPHCGPDRVGEVVKLAAGPPNPPEVTPVIAESVANFRGR